MVIVAMLAACSKDGAPTKVDQKAEAAKRKATADAEAKAKAKAEPEAKAEPDDDVGDDPLHNGADSLEGLGKSLVDALNAKDGRTLLLLSTNELEYRTRLFGALHPETKGGPKAAWAKLNGQNTQGMKTALTEHGSKGYVFVSLESTTKETHGGLIVHASPTLKVNDGDGKEMELKLLESVIEHPASGTFEILTFGSAAGG